MYFVKQSFGTLTLLGCALNKRIPRVIFRASARWHMIQNVTLRVSTTRTWARVPTFSIDARQMAGAFAVADTLWSTIWRSPDELRYAGTRWRIVNHLTNCIWTAWRWLAEICRLNRFFGLKGDSAIKFLFQY